MVPTATSREDDGRVLSGAITALRGVGPAIEEKTAQAERASDLLRGVQQVGGETGLVGADTSFATVVTATNMAPRPSEATSRPGSRSAAYTRPADGAGREVVGGGARATGPRAPA
jgi:hypothetical protein